MRTPIISWPRVVIAALCITAALGLGCSNNDSSLSASFTSSATTPAANLVKLVKGSAAGTTVVVQVVIYGETTSTDLFSFAFDVSIADPTVVKFVPGSAAAGPALTPCPGETISAIAELGTLGGGGVDNSRVVVGVTKLGTCAGNGIAAGASPAVVSLTFQTLKAGTTTLTLSGSPTPRALDGNGTPIATITFDAAPASMTGISTGGGGY